MNLYLVSRTDEVDYEEVESFVCVAKSSLQAREMHPSNPIGEWPNDGRCHAWIRKDQISTLNVIYLGKASPRFSTPEIILKDTRSA